MKKTSLSCRHLFQPGFLALLFFAAGPLRASTVAYWRFEGDGTNVTTANALVTGFNQHTAIESTGLQAVDSSGNGNTIFAFASSGYNGFFIEYENIVPAAAVTQTGAANNWAVWIAPNGNLYPAIATWSAKSTPAGTNIETITPKAWTIEASINSSSYSGYNNHTFVGRDGNHVANSDPNLAPLYFQVNNGNNANLVISFADKAGSFYTIQDPASLALNQWYNVAAVSDGTNLFLYKDILDGNGYQLVGKLAETSTNTALAIPTGTYATMSDGSTWPWTVGRGRYGTDPAPNNNHTDRFFGYVDEVRLSDRALQPSQFLFAPTNVYVLQGPSPTNLVVPLGAPASFSVVVGGINARVQWQHAGTNILGATNLTYSIAATVAGQDGAYNVVVTNAYSTNVSSIATLQFHAPLNLVWAGTGSSWDTTTTDWTTNNGTGTLAYVETDNVRFDPLGLAQPTVYLGGTLNPTSITVSNASYTLTSGGIASGSLLVRSGASLVLDTPDTSSGPATINGTLQVGNGDTGITLGSGPLTNNGALLFNLGGDITISQAIAGNGSGNITNLGSAGAVFLLGNVTANAINMAGTGALVLQGSNTLTAGLTVSSSVAYPQNSFCLGSAPVTVNSGAQLYLNYNLNFAGSSLTLAGGLLHKGGAGLTIFGGPVALTADSEIHNDGGASLTFTNPAGIAAGGNNLTLSGDGGSVGTVSGSVTGALSLTKNGGGLWLLAGNANAWPALALNAGTLQIGDGGADGSLGGGAIQDNSTLAFNSAASLLVTNEIDGAGGVAQNGSGTVTLANVNNSYNGLTTVASGTLLINGTAGYGGVTASGGTLGGTGVINSASSILPGATLAPGVGGVGTLTLASDLTLGGNLAIDVNKTLAPSNDVVAVAGALACTNTGTVTIKNLGPALQVGDKFTLFSQPVSGGGLLAISTAGGIIWSNTLAVDGSVSVVATNVPRPLVKTIAVVGTNLIVTGGHGVTNGTFYVLGTTNLTLPRASWPRLATNAFDANGNFNLTNPVTAGSAQSFYSLQLP